MLKLMMGNEVDMMNASAFLLALTDPDKDGLEEMKPVREQMCRLAEEHPEDAEYYYLDVFQSVYALQSARGEGKTEKVSALLDALFEGRPFEWRVISNGYDLLYRNDQKYTADDAEAAYEAGDAEKEHYPVYAYLMKRELLNRLMSGNRFLMYLEQVRKLTADLKETPEDIKEKVTELGCSPMLSSLEALYGNG